MGNSLESVSDPEEGEDDMLDDNGSTRLGVSEGDGDDEGDVADVVVADGDCHGSTREDNEEDLRDELFDASEGAVIAGDCNSSLPSQIVVKPPQ